MTHSTTLPTLRMLPTESLMPHEDCDPRRIEILSRRILEEGLLKNPPIVAEVPGSDLYVVLDGANRTMALAEAGVAHIVAQVVSYDDPGVILDTWFHIVSGMDAAIFEHGLAGIGGVRMVSTSLEQARQSLDQDDATAYVVNGGGVRLLVSELDTYNAALEILKDLVAVYRGNADIFRASNDIWEIQKPFYPEIVALVVFPRLKPEHILNCAINNSKVPSGITRHVIPTRALHVNIPIGILMADWDIERKRKWLEGWWMERMSANAIRYYAESTFSFNE